METRGEFKVLARVGKVRIILCPFEPLPQLIIALGMAVVSHSFYQLVQLAMEL